MTSPSRRWLVTLVSLATLIVALARPGLAAGLAIPGPPGTAWTPPLPGPHPSPVPPLLGAAPGCDTDACWQAAESAIGPLDARRVYHGTLPASWAADPQCSALPAGDTCVVSYVTPDVNVTAYAASVPAGASVILAWRHEPEYHMTAAAFQATFAVQSAEIRAARNPAVKIAAINGSGAYASPAGAAWGCGYIPPASEVDYYLADAYSRQVDGLWNDAGLARWLACTHGTDRRRGLAEWGVAPSSCSTSGMSRAQEITADYAWARTVMPWAVLLAYYWADRGAGGKPTTDPCKQWAFTEPDAVAAWRALPR